MEWPMRHGGISNKSAARITHASTDHSYYTTALHAHLQDRTQTIGLQHVLLQSTRELGRERNYKENLLKLPLLIPAQAGTNVRG